MPLYEYEATVKTECPTCRQRFEVYQRFDEPALVSCPDCGNEVRKVISAPAIHGPNVLSNKNLAEKGFTKYVKSGDGVYEKQTGNGPDVIHR
jgi:putative FmdB family regulatory protein